ncbi:hypothetical protein [Polaribacter porphyrae]|uniref:CBM11 domain-containing protein n=1 Tax=Polaribacter porphyrae TaxID=1137780 RepID=A0A2S7WSR5_9FLAO|nr:hypothetical protein [Polaribacter porphyrae]PQJ80634.1 hypothetical protein BTO18_16270 [Polaribacter porphyrae]
MKNQIILCFVLLLTVTINAQYTIVDFEDDGKGKPDTNATAEWTGDPKLPEVAIVANPNPSGINTSANVVKFVETKGSNKGNSLQLAFNNSTAKTGHSFAGDNKVVKLMVYSENQTTFDILLEIGSGDTANFSQTKTVNTTQNTWTEVVFDFSAKNSKVNSDNYGKWNSQIRLHFNEGKKGEGDTYYVDNYVLTN